MDQEKVILFFSDLEGTILNDANGEYTEEDMQIFLDKIKRLQELTSAKVHLHIVSPLYKEEMENIINQLDYDISKFNKKSSKTGLINEIEGATAFTKEGDEEIEGKIFPLKQNAYDMDLKAGKSHYVKMWCEYYDEKDSLLMSIYCGNGKNDIPAMQYINSRRDGLTICTNGSPDEMKKISSFSSDKDDLQGVSDCVNKINCEIEERTKAEDIEER